MNMHSDKTPQANVILKQLDHQFACNEVGNMERFISQHKNKVRYIPERKVWAIWDDSRWLSSDHSKVFALALETAKSIYDEARDCSNEEGRKRLTSWAVQSQTDKRINSMIKMASNNPEIVTSIEKFDNNLDLINCLNGIVNLKTGELIEHTPSNHMMKLAPVNYNPNSTCPRFDKFLHEIFNGDIELIGWMQRAIGYSITGHTSEQLFFLAYGTGANGKSTLFETILDIIGEYGKAAEFDTFLASDRSNTRVMEAIAKLQGIRFALASETDSSKRFSEALIKKITGGDTVTGSFLYGSSFEFRPEFKIWLLANHLPIAKDGSFGFWRRVKVIPFNCRFSENQMDQNLRDNLLAEKEGIFAWCIQGAIDWFKQTQESGGRSGIGDCKAIEEATNLYRSDNDIFGRFIEDYLEEEIGTEIPAQKLYDYYKQWCEEVGEEHPCNQIIFSSRLQERSIKKKRKKTGNVYLNVRLQAKDWMASFEEDF